MKKVIAAFSGLGLLGVAAMLMGPTGGYPANPSFNTAAFNTQSGGAGSTQVTYCDPQNTPSVCYLSRIGSTGTITFSTSTAAAPAVDVSQFLQIGENSSAQSTGITFGVRGDSLGPTTTTNSPDNVEVNLVNDTGTLSSGVYSGWANNGTLIGIIATGGVGGAPCTLGKFCIASQVSGNNLELYTVGTGQVRVNSIPQGQTFDATLAAGGVTVNSNAGLGTVAGTRSGVGIYQITATAGTITRAVCTQRSNGGIPAVIQISSIGGGVINLATYTLGGALSDVTGSWECIVT
jgi:hypothetical protein